MSGKVPGVTGPRRRGGPLYSVLALASRAGVFGVGAVVFFALGTAMRRDWLQPFDLAVGHALRVSAGDSIEGAVRAVTMAGNGEVLTSVAVVSVVVLWARRRMPMALYVAACAAGAGLLNTLLKFGFARPRPEWRLSDAFGYSFPSGHAMVGAAVYLSLGLMFAHGFERWRVPIVIVTSLWIFVLGASRIGLGVHYTSDVLGGWLLGITWALWLRPLLVPPRERRPAD